MDAVASTDLTGRARLRRAAPELFAEQGFKATSPRSVAARAGLSPALVIRHFGSKQGLRTAVDQDVLARIGEALRWIDEDSGDLMASLGQVSARLFGADPVLRGFLRHALLEDSEASAALFGRLLDGARTGLDRLAREHGGGASGPDQEWAPFQVLCLILGPLLLERVMQPHLRQPMFAPDALARRSSANQRLLSQGFWGQPQEPSGG
ncbi:helix-turn-helix domain-containing protein [Streptomyces sp. NPDC001817]|uniref:TetR/AcrR family transcriptional regulator n=1 Tax=Streptomyces sp. NPDC001817 TaxID=3154398 RepID=UPI00332AC947